MTTGAEGGVGAPAEEHRSLAAVLGAMSDDDLASLFRQRPDLARPLPEDFTALAAHATAAPSVRLAWGRLNRLQRQVLEILIAHPAPPSREHLLVAIGAADDPVAVRHTDEAVAGCASLALLWRDRAGLRAVAAVAALTGPTPCGLDPLDRTGLVRIRRYLDNPQSLFDELDDAPTGVRGAVDRLLWGPPRGSLPRADRAVSAATARTPAEWLLARDLLVPDGPDSVILPREVALLLRAGRYVREPALPPGPPLASDVTIADADATGGMHALAFVRNADRALEVLQDCGPRVLRAGGMYQRDAAELARRLHLDLPATALVADALLRTGLIAEDMERGVWALTRTADTWRLLDEERRWAVLALAWLDSPAQPSLAATDNADRRILSDGLIVAGTAEVRRAVLAIAADTRQGAPIDATAMTDAVAWRQPRLAGMNLASLVADILSEADAFGLFGRRAMTRAGRALVQDAEPTAVAARLAWPSLVEHLVLQADLTATAPGPLTASALARIGRLADIESAGAGSVYRFSASTLQRAFDAGRSTAEVTAELADLSATGLPSTLEALVADVGRRHGAVRVSAAASVVTTDDDAALSAALADKSLAHLHLHRLAAGVAVSHASPAEITAALRRCGVMAVTAHPPATRPRRVPPASPSATAPTAPDPIAAVRSVRAGAAARAALAEPGRLSAIGPHDLVAALATAIRDRASVWLDVTDATGTRRVRHVQPLTLRSGMLSGFDQREHRVLGFPLSRIAGMALVETGERPETSPAQS